MDKNALEQGLSSYNWWMGVSTVAVAAGILGEYVAHFAFEKEARRNRLEMGISILFGVLVLGGVVGEYVFGKRLSQVSEELQQIADVEVAQSNKDAAQARRDAETAKQQSADGVERAGKAEQRAAEANGTAEQERLARVEIEEALAARRLGSKENALLQDRLRQFAGEGAGIVYFGGDAEGFTFAWDIAKALHDAKWAVPTPGGIIEMQEVGLPFDAAFAKLRSGVEVVDMGTPQSRVIARALADALNACGFDATTDSRPGQNVSTGVQITVETRPLGPQGAAKLRVIGKKGRR